MAERAVLEFIAKAKHYTWSFVELGFVALLAMMLIYLILGQGSGVFVLSVAQNVIKFANDVPPGALVALAIIGTVLYGVSLRRRVAR